MNSELLFECWCVFATKLKIYNNRIEIGSFFGLSTVTIPTQKLASVNNGLTGIVFENTGGGKTKPIAPWNGSNKNKIVETVIGLIESH